MEDQKRPGLSTLAIYNPDLLSKADLIRFFIARKRLLQRILEDLRRETGRGAPQHRLIIGQRGMGKTTFLRRLGYAIEDDAELSLTWLPLVFPEEQYNISRLSDLWLNCLDALCDALEQRTETDAAKELDRAIDELDRQDEERLADAALRLLGSWSERLKRRLVLLLDNIDLVFSRLKGSEWALREVLSHEPALLIVGASSVMLETTFRYDEAFYDFFLIHELEGLTEEETFEFLQGLADASGSETMRQILEGEPGRVRALRVLTGGNHAHAGALVSDSRGRD